MVLGRILPAILAVLVLVPAGQAQSPHRRPFYRSKAFWIAFTVDVAASAADVAGSQHAFRQGGHETDPIFGARRPSTARMLAIGLPIAFGTVLGSYELHNRLPEGHWWRNAAWAPVAWDAANHARLAAHDFSLMDSRPRARARLLAPKGDNR